MYRTIRDKHKITSSFTEGSGCGIF